MIVGCSALEARFAQIDELISQWVARWSEKLQEASRIPLWIIGTVPTTSIVPKPSDAGLQAFPRKSCPTIKGCRRPRFTERCFLGNRRTHDGYLGWWGWLWSISDVSAIKFERNTFIHPLHDTVSKWARLPNPRHAACPSFWGTEIILEGSVQGTWSWGYFLTFNEGDFLLSPSVSGNLHFPTEKVILGCCFHENGHQKPDFVKTKPNYRDRAR